MFVDLGRIEIELKKLFNQFNFTTRKKKWIKKQVVNNISYPNFHSPKPIPSLTIGIVLSSEAVFINVSFW